MKKKKTKTEGLVAPQTDITEAKELNNVIVPIRPIIKEIDDGVFHTGDKLLYSTPPDVEWNCCCIKGDKDLCVFLFKCGISSAVLGFCMLMLINDNKDGFYISTISLILGGVMGSNTDTKKKDATKKT